jgi:RNA polymerase sigma-70 factor (ECF subfamily)
MQNEASPNISSQHDKLNKEIAAFVRSAQSGDEQAFGRLYDIYFDRIYAFVFYRVHHKEVAEDISEEVFIKAWTRVKAVKAESFGGWLYSITRNTLIDHYRKQRETVDLSEIENLIESDQDVIAETDLQINQKLLLEMIRKLTPEQQIIMKLKFLEGMETEEVSEMISKSSGSIRVVQHRAIQRLLELMQEKENQNKSSEFPSINTMHSDANH